MEDYYTKKNIFWVPKAACWYTLKDKAMLPTCIVLWVDETTGNYVKLGSVTWLVDNPLDGIEKNTPKMNLISQFLPGTRF